MNWYLELSGRIVQVPMRLSDAILWGQDITRQERNVRLVAPNGMRLTVAAARLLTI